MIAFNKIYFSKGCYCYLVKGDITMKNAIVVLFIFIVLALSGCASSSNTKTTAADMDAQYRMFVKKIK